MIHCYFDLYSSRGAQIDRLGDDFQDIQEARRMARALTLDYAQYQFPRGEECIVVCNLRTDVPERYYLTSLAILDEFAPLAGAGRPASRTPGRDAPREQARLSLSDGGDVAYRMSADWTDMRELRSDGFLRQVIEPERAWLMTYIPLEERARVAAAIDSAIRHRMPFNLEHKVIRADETVGLAVSRALPVVDEHGDICEWIGVAKDVTERHKA